jgi:hypothetical protein
MRTCFLSSQTNAIGGFSARLNGVRRGHPAKMSSLQKQETPRRGLSGTHPFNEPTLKILSQTGPPGTKRGAGRNTGGGLQ